MADAPRIPCTSTKSARAKINAALMRCHSGGCGMPTNCTTVKNRTVGWDQSCGSLSLYPLLRLVESEGAQATRGIAALSQSLTLQSVTMPVASATRDVLRRRHVQNFDGSLLLLFHFKWSFLVFFHSH